ncbi:NAD(P)-dependent oxidoreductase [Azospirillum sp. ST 5-10]|uniref:NAD(P)-dependent oxidoreductase n=1 Tax=unclassified Azospirillum TaxID=2630922 RepID=UPI003F4A1B87
MTLAVVAGPMAIAWIDPLTRATAGDWDFVAFDPARPDPAAMAAATAAITPSFDARWPAAPALRLIQVPLVGVDQIDWAAVPDGVAVCHVTGHDVAVAEYVVLAMLAAARDFVGCVADFTAGSWARGSRAGGPLRRELAGATLGLIGLGGIGRAVAERAAALGMRVVACNRSTDAAAAGVADLRPLSEIAAVVGEADFIVVAIALTEATRGLIDARVLAAAKPTATLINVARGDCVDEAALYEACRDGRLGAAVLDVWYRYPSAGDPDPAPSRYPFADLPNVTMTPHVSAWTTGTVDRRVAQIAENLRRLREGLPLRFRLGPPARETPPW